jgi:predicted acylesterase/phospholipase RssA
LGATWGAGKPSQAAGELLMLGEIRLGLLTALVLAGCASASLRDVVPERLVGEAEIPGMADVRTWGDSGAEAVTTFLKQEGANLKAKYAARGKDQHVPEAHMLAISGGGDDGAFAAGLLVGWSAHGDRPQFDLVTGISAGALTAPFAFLGKDYDRQLAGLFVHGGEDIYQATLLEGLFGGNSVADSEPLARLIATYVDHRMLGRIGAERAKGRILLVGTTNLDAQRPVYWDMGKIALSRRPEKLDLFRRVLLASASLPGVFPPVHIKVIANGKTYEEMHVDGGPTRQVFFTPADFDFRELDKVIGRRVTRHLWVIRNGKIAPEYSAVSESALAIAGRSLETLTKNQGIGDLIRMHDKARAEGIDFNLAHIPADFSAPRPAPFDEGYMHALFERGVALGRAGYVWEKAAPGGEVGPTTASGR